MTNTDNRGVTRVPAVQVWGPLVALWLIWGSTYLGSAVMGRSLPPLMGNGMRFAVAVAVAVGMGGLILMLLPGGTTPVSGTDRDVAIWSAAILVSSFSWAFFSWRSAT